MLLLLSEHTNGHANRNKKEMHVVKFDKTIHFLAFYFKYPLRKKNLETLLINDF